MFLPLGICTVRNWRHDDASSLVRHANNRNVWINLRDRFPHPYGSGQAEQFLGRVVDARPETSFAIAVDGEAVGGIGVVLHDDVERISAELGYWLGEAFWGRGITTAAVRAVTDYAMTTFALCRVYAVPFAYNTASARVLEKAGYALEGRMRRSAIKDGRVVDQFLYAATRDVPPEELA